MSFEKYASRVSREIRGPKGSRANRACAVSRELSGPPVQRALPVRLVNKVLLGPKELLGPEAYREKSD
jgi:hypothetical protein